MTKLMEGRAACARECVRREERQRGVEKERHVSYIFWNLQLGISYIIGLKSGRQICPDQDPFHGREPGHKALAGIQKWNNKSKFRDRID